MLVDWLDDPLCLQLSQRLPRQATIDLQSFNENTDTDESIGADFFEKLFVSGFVEEDGIVGFILDLAFRPLLFLGCRC